MKLVLMSLCIIPLVGCQVTNEPKIIIQRELVREPPPAAYLLECIPPFSEPPKTYGDAVTRDEVWLQHFKECACRVEKNRKFYSHSINGKMCEKIVVQQNQ